IDLDLEVPDGAIDGQEIQIKVSYQNTSADTLERVRLRMTYPDGFTFLSADPSPRSGGNNVWQDDVLAELEAKEIIINGTISGEVGSMKQVVAEIGIIKADGLFSLQTESYSLLNILEPDSDLQLIVNNNYEDSIIDWGSDLAWQLIFKNNGQIVLNDIALTVTWSQTPADILDLDSLQDDNEGQVTSTSLTWTSEQIEDLAVVRPGDEVIIDWLLATKDYNDLTIEEGDINWQLTSQAVASSDSLTDTGSGFSQESNLIINKIGTTSSFNAEGRYFDDDLDKVGAGPLPPEVGQKTTYKIYWFLSNTTNQLEDVVIKAQIPANAEWEGSSTVSPSGTLDYNKTTREVTWTIKQLETFYGSLLPEARATFLVSITPASSDIGDLLTLTNQATLTATDGFTNQTITDSQPIIDTDLANDLGAENKGEVIKSTSTNNNININTNQNSNTNSGTNTNSQ
ncbi:hypothetical protein KKI23_00235, partial [Patescibacteria group bacterium]|nr:hypothetical protein [Patescibacteria group bacterium]